MAESRRDAERAADKFGESAASGAAAAEQAVEGASAVAERIGNAAARQAERVAAGGREGVRQAAQAAESGTKAALRSGETIADGVREIAQTWVHYAEEVMRHSSQASQALMRCRNWGEILEVQTGLLRDNTRAFLDQSAKVAEIGSRLATRPFEAMKETAEGDKSR